MSPESQSPDFVIIGRIIKPHGVRGAVKVEPITEVPKRYADLDNVFIGTEDQPGEMFEIARVQFQNKIVILMLKGIESRSQAEALRNSFIHIPADQVLALPDGSIYIFDLIGLPVYTNKNEYIGTVTNYLEYPANNVFVVEYEDRELLIPDVPDIVKDVDLDAGKILINPIPGLLD
jgi:16S rRNA processing protein RimM